MGGLAIVVDRKAKPIRGGDLMAYGLFELAQRRAAGLKPSMVFVLVSSHIPESAKGWWRFSDVTPAVVIMPNDRVNADEFFPLSGLDVLMSADAITDQVESALSAVQQFANCITFVSDVIDGGGFCWHSVNGEKLLGDRYAVAA